MRAQHAWLCLLAAGCGLWGAVSLAADDKAQQAEIQRQRQAAAHRPRRIIMNNDGNDARTRPDEPRTVENFLSKRTTALAGTQVDAIFYCSGVFNLYHHRSTESEARQRGDRSVVDWAWELGEKGPDSLASVVTFGHQHKMEVFWSMRMNDTHDSGDPALLCQWKREHPEYLMGKKGEPFVAGGRRWSAVNYELPEVREKVLRILRDVATRYDVDGLELDFFRHPIYFKPQMFGKPVTQEQRDLMSDLLARVRKMGDEVAASRGRPLLIAVRVPDSVEYCSAVGLDLVRWLKEDLVDMLAVSCYFQLNPWKTSIELGHRYGVPVYPCLSEPRFDKTPEADQVRKTTDCYRGRALDAWNAGADGIYVFNYFNPRAAVWRELGDRTALQTMSQIYPAGTTSTRQIKSWLADGMRWLNQPIPLPENPRTLMPGERTVVEIAVASAAFARPGASAQATVRVLTDDVAQAAALTVKLNDQPLAGGQPHGKWLDYVVAPSVVKQGVNRLEVTAPTTGGRLTVADAVVQIEFK